MNFTKATWRLIKSHPAEGVWNMAVDEAIFEAVGREEAAPTFRLYSWSSPCLSLGHAQPVSNINSDSLKSNNWDLVRRLTGGRAILHADELTYSVIGSHREERLSGGILRSYLVLSRAILRALQQLGITALADEEYDLNGSSGTDARKKNQNPVCFEVPSNYEITVYGKKLIGSAQARRRDGVLQHGTFPLFGDLTRIIQVLQFQDKDALHHARKRLSERATTAEAVLGYPLDWDSAAQAFIAAFQEELNLELLPSELTPTELTRAQILVEEKYANPEWTERI